MNKIFDKIRHKRKQESSWESETEDEYDDTYHESTFSSDSSDSEDDEDDIEDVVESEECDNRQVKWEDASSSFVPRKTIPLYQTTKISLNDGYNEIDTFLTLFPKSLFMWIATCTNERLKLMEIKNKKIYTPTDYHEVMIVIGCTIVMSYNRVPYMSMLWSNNPSLRNEAIASAITRDRFLLLSSKLYFNHPEKPGNAGKTYYMDELLNCLKYTFNRARSEATYQSIDECMIKCKARTSIKQFMKEKPTKRGVKGWVRADAESGYVYDLNIYTGKSVEKLEGTLGERVRLRYLLFLVKMFFLEN